MKIAITGRDVVAGLVLRAGARQVTFFDHGHPDCVVGFGLRVRATGARTWVFQYKFGAKHQRMKLGSWPTLSLEKARGKARKYREDVDGGGNPASIRAEERLRSTETFGRIIARYLAHRSNALKPRSYVETERHLNRYAKPPHGQPHGDIAALPHTIPPPARAENFSSTRKTRKCTLPKIGRGVFWHFFPNCAELRRPWRLAGSGTARRSEIAGKRNVLASWNKTAFPKMIEGRALSCHRHELGALRQAS